MKTANTTEKIIPHLGSFSSISVKDLQSVSLLNRCDSKYVFNVKKSPGVFKKLCNNYNILSIKSQRVFPYKTVYFDTPDLQFFHAHHNGKLNRYKVRSREYVGLNKFFNEIKFKSNKGNTIKSRMKRSHISSTIDHNFAKFLTAETTLDPNTLVAKLFVFFNRITLVDKQFTERVTIDFGLQFTYKRQAHHLNTLVIAEVKKDKYSNQAHAETVFKDERIYTMGCSKYCVGISALHTNIKTGNLKPRLQRLQRIIDQPN